MSAQHTPGPWQFHADLPSADPNWHIVTNATRMCVVANVHIEPGNEMAVANARLIAAAPELLEALKKRRDVDVAYSRLALMDVDDNERERLLQQIEDAEEAACDAARAAIAKAEGAS